MGNELHKQYDVPPDGTVCTAGPHGLWKIYSAVKRSTKEQVSIFTAERKEIERRLGPHRNSVPDVLRLLKKGAQNLTKLRHPHILRVVDPLVESKTDLFFVTEPVLASLDNLLGNADGVQDPQQAIRNYKTSFLETQMAACALLEALRFLHQDARMMHLNLAACNMLVTTAGEWKLAGFEYSAQEASEVKLFSPHYVNTPLLFPSLEFAAPEYVTQSHPTSASDIWSLGVLLYRFFSLAHGQPAPPLLSCRSPADYLQCLQPALSAISFPVDFPQDISETVLRLLTIAAPGRPTIAQLLETSPMCCGKEIRALRFLANLMEKDPVMKVNFLKDLKDLLPGLPLRILKLKVLPPLVRELSDDRMVRFALPLLLGSLNRLEPAEYEALLLPTISSLMQRIDMPQILQLLVGSLDAIIAKSSPTIVKHNIVPFLCVQMRQSPNTEVVTAVVRQATALAQGRTVAYSDFKKDILPSLLHTMRSTKDTGVRCAVITGLAELLELMDRDTIHTVVEPSVKTCLQHDRHPAVAVAVARVYRSIAQYLGIDAIATQLIPGLAPVLMIESLTGPQFAEVIGVIRDLLARVEAERAKHFRLDSMYQTLETGDAAAAAAPQPRAGPTETSPWDPQGTPPAQRGPPGPTDPLWPPPAAAPAPAPQPAAPAAPVTAFADLDLGPTWPPQAPGSTQPAGSAPSSQGPTRGSAAAKPGAGASAGPGLGSGAVAGPRGQAAGLRVQAPTVDSLMEVVPSLKWPPSPTQPLGALASQPAAAPSSVAGSFATDFDAAFAESPAPAAAPAAQATGIAAAGLRTVPPPVPKPRSNANAALDDLFDF